MGNSTLMLQSIMCNTIVYINFYRCLCECVSACVSEWVCACV